MTGRPSLCMALAFASTRRVADSAIAEIRVDSRVVGLTVSAYPQAYSRGWGGWVCWALYARHPKGPIPAVGRETLSPVPGHSPGGSLAVCDGGCGGCPSRGIHQRLIPAGCLVPVPSSNTLRGVHFLPSFVVPIFVGSAGRGSPRPFGPALREAREL